MQGSSDSIHHAACEYCEWCAAHPEFSIPVVAGAVQRGAALVSTAGHWTKAVEAYRTAWQTSRGNHLAGVADPSLDALLAPDLLAYLRHVAAKGVETRQEPAHFRWRAKPHQSAVDHILECFQKMWKDAARGRLLLVSSELGAELIGVLCEPIGCVPKLNPDRTVSDEHRFIHDARKINLRGHKHDHPPALQPRHRGVARRILWWKIRHPASRILLAKRDIDSAFKLIWL